MRTLVLVTALGASGGAFAQGGYNPAGAIIGPVIALGVLEVSLVTSSMVTAVGSTKYQARGWYASSYALGAANALMTGACVFGMVQTARGSSGRPDPTFTVAAIGHGLLALWNLLAPTVALASQGIDEPAISPVALGGRDHAGRRWSGVGVQVTGF